jgi:cbb3-type cytochrome oxidase subunit 3
MESDMIVVLGLALVFFGGICYILWNERKKQQSQAERIQAPSPESGNDEKELFKKPRH